MRLIAWTGGAMVLLLVMAGNAFAYLHEGNARFIASSDRNNNLNGYLSLSGYNPAAVFAATPGNCLDPAWDVRFNGGCYKRKADYLISYSLGTRYFSQDQRPSSNYLVSVFGSDACNQSTTDAATIYWQNGSTASPYFSVSHC